ncbi:MAG: division/cell wall cluster transcriptional repressor MraZ [Armatimonadota bacterium]|nr:division/cell wall cluster transcriptional repressor MraZ [bacterium]
MFSGAYEHSVDEKGRTVMPARFRQKLGESFIMTKGLHGCLWVFPERTWTRLQQKLTPKSFLDERGIKLERYFLGAASECMPDKQGRINISPILMNHAGISQGEGVLIVGLTDKVEIWSKSRWDEFNACLTDDVIAQLGA